MQQSDPYVGSYHILLRGTCGISDWLGMALMVALAFGLAIVLGLTAVALCKYVFSSGKEVPR